MADDQSSLESKFKELTAGWSFAAALGAFLLYTSGYLAQRFYLRVLGIDAEMPLVSEGAVYFGAGFLYYFINALPIVLIPLAILFVFRARLQKWHEKCVSLPPAVHTLAGASWAILGIQLLERQIFFVQRLLIGGPFKPEFLQRIMIEGERPQASRLLFFALLMALCLPTFYCAAQLPGKRPWLPQSYSWRPAQALLYLLGAIQLLFLPVYFGAYMAVDRMPRIELTLKKPADPTAEKEPKPDGALWKLHADDQYTYFLREPEGVPAARRIVALKTDLISKLEIVGYDELVKRVCGAPKPSS